MAASGRSEAIDPRDKEEEIDPQAAEGRVPNGHREAALAGVGAAAGGAIASERLRLTRRLQ